MEYIKGSLIILDGREVMVELPKDWNTKLESKFLVCKNFTGDNTAFILESVFNIREVTDVVWNNFLTRLKLAKEEAKRKIAQEAKKKVVV